MEIEIFFLLFVLIILVWVIYSTVIGGGMGAPFVVTPDNILNKILEKADLKPGEIFWDVGCGDGKVVKAAMKKYRVLGYGVEINPILCLICLFKGIKIYWTSIENINLAKADVVYMYLGPEIVETVARKLENHNKSVILISRRFEIKTWKKYEWKKMSDGDNLVYFYKL